MSTLVKLELAHINTNHPDFIGGARAVAQLSEPQPEQPPQRPPPPSAPRTAAGAAPLDPATLLRRTMPDGTRIGALFTSFVSTFVLLIYSFVCSIRLFAHRLSLFALYSSVHSLFLFFFVSLSAPPTGHT